MHYRVPLHDRAWMYLVVAGLAIVLMPLAALPALRAAKALPTHEVVHLLGAE